MSRDFGVCLWNLGKLPVFHLSKSRNKDQNTPDLIKIPISKILKRWNPSPQGLAAGGPLNATEQSRDFDNRDSQPCVDNYTPAETGKQISMFASLNRCPFRNYSIQRLSLLIWLFPRILSIGIPIVGKYPEFA